MIEEFEDEELEDEELMEGSRNISVDNEDSDDESGKVIVKTVGNIGAGRAEEQEEVTDVPDVPDEIEMTSSFEHTPKPAILWK